MNKEEFIALCARAKKDGPIASWITTDIHNHSLSRQYLAMRSAFIDGEWRVYSFREGEGVNDLGAFHGAAPLEVYKAVPRKVLA
jgi:hypothetical protein